MWYLLNLYAHSFWTIWVPIDFSLFLFLCSSISLSLSLYPPLSLNLVLAVAVALSIAWFGWSIFPTSCMCVWPRCIAGSWQEQKIIAQNMLAEQVENGNFSFYIANKIRYTAADCMCVYVIVTVIVLCAGTSGCWFQFRPKWIKCSETVGYGAFNEHNLQDRWYFHVNIFPLAGLNPVFFSSLPQFQFRYNRTRKKRLLMIRVPHISNMAMAWLASVCVFMGQIDFDMSISWNWIITHILSNWIN